MDTSFDQSAGILNLFVYPPLCKEIPQMEEQNATHHAHCLRIGLHRMA